ncbi:MAG TPA: alpha/beta hydrolase [Candidatus Dormibacteraeota bacterium]|nr:alpha/beta hydrolase [Candidatus Dormibacteraeota bacterium]
MNRRNLLTSAISATAGAALLATDSDAIWANGTKSADAKSNLLSRPFLETRDHATLFCKDWGAGKPVVFVHSWALNSDMWQYQMIHLSGQGLRCIAYDQRGHGRSSQPGYGYDYDTLADDLASLIEQLDLREVTLVAHSMGCGEVVRYLSRHGSSRVARAVLISTATPFALKTPDNPDGTDKAIFEKLRASWTKDFPKWLGENARPFFVPETSPEMMQWVVRMCLQASLKALIDCNRAGMETDFRTELAAITVPTLIIHGDADVSEPIEQRGRRTAQLIPGSQFKVYEGAPHGLMFTHTDRLNADLLAFITR